MGRESKLNLKKQLPGSKTGLFALFIVSHFSKNFLKGDPNPAKENSVKFYSHSNMCFATLMLIASTFFLPNICVYEILLLKKN